MVNLICFFITAEFTLFSCLFYSPLIQNSRLQDDTDAILCLFSISLDFANKWRIVGKTKSL
ncbi:hypothetical protein [Wolbachia endosymbiont (group B) of Ennomos erosarius]|uniref:hypothetical protein n=1 Tax=Wolbachia endosymbiont (group B) of Ennomos erosarius TaxID=3066175 RepID=UPI0031332E89